MFEYSWKCGEGEISMRIVYRGAGAAFITILLVVHVGGRCGNAGDNVGTF